MSLVLDVGGTKFETTRMTIERSSYLTGKIDSDEAHSKEYFIDRDPETFALLLRLMRQMPLVAGLLPHDREKFAVLLAEADFFGFDALLDHVKARAFYHLRALHQEYPRRSFLPAEHATTTDAALRKAMMQEATNKRLEAWQEVQALFRNKDEQFGSHRFDVLHGSIADALASELLPGAYFAAPKQSVRILQLLPVEATTWFLIGDAHDDRATVVQGAHYPDPDEMKPMRQIIQHPNLVRRVACHALCETVDGTSAFRGKQWMEPMVYVGPDDMDEWMNHQPGDRYIVSRDNTLGDPSCSKQTGGAHVRTMRASEYLKLVQEKVSWGAGAYSSSVPDFWTHLHVADEPPNECAFLRSDLVHFADSGQLL